MVRRSAGFPGVPSPLPSCAGRDPRSPAPLGQFAELWRLVYPGRAQGCPGLTGLGQRDPEGTHPPQRVLRAAVAAVAASPSQVVNLWSWLLVCKFPVSPPVDGALERAPWGRSVLSCQQRLSGCLPRSCPRALTRPPHLGPYTGPCGGSVALCCRDLIGVFVVAPCPSVPCCHFASPSVCVQCLS